MHPIHAEVMPNNREKPFSQKTEEVEDVRLDDVREAMKKHLAEVEGLQEIIGLIDQDLATGTWPIQERARIAYRRAQLSHRLDELIKRARELTDQFEQLIEHGIQ